MKKTQLAVCLLAGLLVGLSSARGAGGSWWNKDWQYRRRVIAQGSANAPGADICYVEFLTGGHVKKDGSDIRVVEGRTLVPHRVLFVGPGDFVKLVIEVNKKGRARRVFHVYYGNPAAKPVAYDFEVQRGLLLEVRHYRGGNIGNWRQMQDTLRRSKGHTMGVGFVDTVFQGYNPFGPSENIVNIYRGWMLIRKPGNYIFTTTSDDASFLLVDRKMVVQWAGVHRAVPYARKQRQRPLRLSQGMHKFEYYHVQLGGQEAAVAAWRPPWEKNPKKFYVIPKDTFPQPITGSVGSPEKQGGGLVADFISEKVGEAYINGKPIVRIGFRHTTRPRPVGAKPPKWDFGDGNQGQGAQVQHIYLAPGLYKVTVSLDYKGKTYTTAQVIDAFQDWNKQIERKTDDLAKYYRVVRGYNFARMSPACLIEAAEFFEKLGKPADMATVSQVMLKRAKEFGDDDLYKRTVAFAQSVSQHFGKHRQAIQALGIAEKTVKAVPFKARLALEAGDIAVKHWANAQVAITHYQRALKQYPKAGSDVKRHALVGIGDCYRLQGEYDKAYKQYEAAQMIPVSGQPYQKAAVRVGTLAKAIEYYIRSRQPQDKEAAEQFLNTWEWEYPLQKLQGHSALLRGQLYAKLKRYDEAIAEMEALIAVNPKSNCVGQILITLAECYFAKKDPKKAKDVLQTLIEDYKDSGQVEKAKQMLKNGPPKPASPHAKRKRKR